jgi:nucleoside-diphosphate-sugar epimerase
MNTPIAIKSAIITGATGPVGLKLVEFMAARGVRMLVAVNPSSTRNNALRGLPVSIEYRGLQNLEALNPAGTWDAFFHLGWTGTDNRLARNDALEQAKNIKYSLDAVELASRAGCKVFVGTGSQAEYGLLPDGIARANTLVAPLEAYGVAKYAAGRLSARRCAELGIRQCWGRILSVYGEYDRPTTLIMYAVSSLLRGENPKFTPCEQLWDYLYAGDCAEALWRMAVSGSHGTAYPLGSGSWQPLKEYLEEIRRQIRPEAHMGYGELPYPEGQVMRMRADTSALELDTGYKPRTNFAEGIGQLAISIVER